MIGIFDSGIGGLTVAKEIRAQLPNYQLVYFGDTARTPYGNKSADTIIEYAVQDTQFLLDRGARIIIVACNTASAVAAEELQKKFPDIPIFEVVSPAVTAAAQHTRNHRIGVIGTRTTIGTNIYKTKLQSANPQLQIYSKACPLFVPLAEEGWIDDQVTKITARRYLAPLKQQQVDTLILGCTHYPILRSVIQQKAGKRVSLIDPATPTVTAITSFLTDHPDIEKRLARTNEHQYFFSDVPTHLGTIASRWLGEKITPQLHHIQ